MDFTIEFYKELIHTVSKRFRNNIFTFKDFLSASKKPEEFCIIRHDVDRNHTAALRMANVEAELGIQATYYFRARNQNFNEKIIRQVKNLGHEVGFHYESLASAKGNYAEALSEFSSCIEKLNEITPVDTISMHGSPLSKYNNLDLWKRFDRSKTFTELGLIGDAVLDIDYSDIAFITDTGRNWSSQKANLRDKVSTGIFPDIKNSTDLLNFIKSTKNKKLVLQIHPERWSNNLIGWSLQYLKDTTANSIKWILEKIRS
jgi:hypothetical protein